MVAGLIWAVIVGVVFNWGGNIAGNLFLFISSFLGWVFKVTSVGHKIFEVRLDSGEAFRLCSGAGNSPPNFKR